MECTPFMVLVSQPHNIQLHYKMEFVVLFDVCVTYLVRLKCSVIQYFRFRQNRNILVRFEDIIKNKYIKFYYI